MDAAIATSPKKGVCTWPTCSRNIRNDPENIPITEPIMPIIISKVLEMVLVLFMFNNMINNIIYMFTNQLLPEVLHGLFW